MSISSILIPIWQIRSWFFTGYGYVIVRCTTSRSVSSVQVGVSQPKPFCLHITHSSRVGSDLDQTHGFAQI